MGTFPDSRKTGTHLDWADPRRDCFEGERGAPREISPRLLTVGGEWRESLRSRGAAFGLEQAHDIALDPAAEKSRDTRE
jgi:hypothetical protein